MCYQHRTAAQSSAACKEPCVSQGWIRKPVIAHNHINREDRMSGSHSASLRAAIPVTCETSQILWMMEWFNITGSSVCGRAAQDINTGSNIVQRQLNCLAGCTAMWKDGSPLGPRTHSPENSIFPWQDSFFYSSVVKACMSKAHKSLYEVKAASPSPGQHGQRCRAQHTCLQELQHLLLLSP